MANHVLKIEVQYLDAKLEGKKLFEIRNNNDRGFQVGDKIIYLRSLLGKNFQRHFFEITFITNFWQKDGYVVFGEKFIKTEKYCKNCPCCGVFA